MKVVVIGARAESAQGLEAAIRALGHELLPGSVPGDTTADVAIVDCGDGGAGAISAAVQMSHAVVALRVGEAEEALRAAFAAGAIQVFAGEPTSEDLRAALIGIELRGPSMPGAGAAGHEQRVAELEERFTKAFHFNPLPAVITRAGDQKILEANERFVALSGWAREELLGHTSVELRLWANPEDRAAVLEAGARGARVANFEARLRRRDGSLRDVRISQQEYEVAGARAVLTMVEDITERLAARRAVERLTSTLTAQQEASPDGVLVVDSDGNVISFNRRYLDIWGLTAEDMTSGLGRREEAARRLLVNPEVTIDLVRELYRTPGRDQHIEVQFTDGRTIETYTTPIIGNDGTSYGRAWYYRDVTERRAAEEALRASEERYRTLVDVSPNAIAVHQGGRVVYLNAAGLAMIGTTMDEITKTDVFALLHPDDRAAVVANAQQTRDDPLPRFVEARLRRSDGEWLTVELASVATTFDGRPATQTVMRDITEQRHALVALQESEERYRGLVDLSPDPTIVQNEREVLYANRAALKAVGATELSQVVGHSPAEFVHRDDWPQASIRRDALLRGERPPADTQRMLRLDGEVRQMEVLAVPVRFNGRWAAQVGFRDVTERIRAEAERRALERKLTESQKLESLGVLAGGIAHDFNNLLVAIMGNTGLAAMELPPGSPLRPYLDEIETASQRAADLARQMLAYAGKGKFVIAPVSLTGVVEEMSHLLSVALPRRVALRLELARNLPQTQADATQIRQIVMNLVLNAGEAIGDNEGLITVTTGAIDAGPADFAGCLLSPELPTGRYVYLDVADTGVGMDEATQKRIFEPFFTTKFTGRGLGLAAVLGIVRGHRGALRVESTPGEGSSFRLMLPAERAEVATSAAPAATGRAMLSGTVLLVDDEEHVLNVAGRILERMGLTVLPAEDAQRARALFAEHSPDIAAVLVDLTMPGVSGADLIRELRAAAPHLPVVVMSGYSEAEAAIDIDGTGYSGFLQKPFTMADVREALAAALRT